MNKQGKRLGAARRSFLARKTKEVMYAHIQSRRSELAFATFMAQLVQPAGLYRESQPTASPTST
ncbi:hypothetical protein B2G74_32995 [Burkholderia sp. A27]|nr:hypothetical protein B2G74_32995 [Burkholderia sp. A27]